MLIVRKLDFDWEHLLCELSEPLRAEVSLQRCHAFLMNQKLRGLLGAGESSTHPQFIKVLVTKMVQVVFSPGDFCIEEGDQGQEVYFLSRGTVVVVVCKSGLRNRFVPRASLTRWWTQLASGAARRRRSGRS